MLAVQPERPSTSTSTRTSTAPTSKDDAESRAIPREDLRRPHRVLREDLVHEEARALDLAQVERALVAAPRPLDASVVLRRRAELGELLLRDLRLLEQEPRA